MASKNETALDRSPEIFRAVKGLYRPGDSVEVRAFDKNGGRFVGRYAFGERGEELAAAITKEDEDQRGRDVYYVANPTKLPPVAATNEGTKETDIARRRWILLDFDPIRKYKIATPEQHTKALDLAHTVKNFLLAEGWTGLLLASSGNGCHVLVPVDLPADEAAKQLVRRVQRAIADRFETPATEIDCFNDGNRLVRAYGSTNRKGEETDSLKWRQSMIVEAEEVPPQPITREQLEDFVTKYFVETAKGAKRSDGAKPRPATTNTGADNEVGAFTYEALEERLELWARHHPDFSFEPGRVSKGDGRGFNIICPGNFPGGWRDGEEHSDKIDRPNGSAVCWVEDGFPRFRCGHSHCDEGARHGKKSWKHLEDFFDPGKLLARGGDVYVGSTRAAGGAASGPQGGSTATEEEAIAAVDALLITVKAKTSGDLAPSLMRQLCVALAELRDETARELKVGDTAKILGKAFPKAMLRKEVDKIVSERRRVWAEKKRAEEAATRQSEIAADGKENLEDIKEQIKALLFSSPDERLANGLPVSREEMESALADLVWSHLKRRGRIFNCGGLGYILLEDHIPVAVISDGADFAYLMQRDYLLKPGERVKHYVGKHIGVMCRSEGETIDLRLSTHFERDANTVYVAEKRGWMLRITKDSITRVPNGTDDQVFLFPKNYEGFNLDAAPSIMESPLAIPASIDKLLFSGMTFVESALSLCKLCQPRISRTS